MAHDSKLSYDEALHMIGEAMNQQKAGLADHTFHCLRSDGSERKYFEMPDEAATFRDTHPNYFGDIIVFCGRCGLFHCSNPNWNVSRPWETPVEKLRMN